ncbi:undecaprenyl diphosphate synthase family protein, partial [Klebsiella pneumoniae]|uniref:undecaprenyl diphosphate synthase family protein n=1 Tax=Klebsiella pneumoniae TaxID=573 RepID=UPI003F247798
VLTWCADLGIRAVTLWVLSTDNLKRAPEQVSGILAAVEGKLAALAHDPRIHRRRVQVRAVGKLELLPGTTLAAIEAAQAATAHYDSMILTIA